MARKAFISSDMAHDERLFDVAQLNQIAALMWPWIVTYLDDWGRGIASAKRIKSQLFPNVQMITVEEVEKALEAYAEVGLLEIYGDDNHRYMAVPSEKWFKWQTHIRREKRGKDNSKYPPCPTDCAQMRDVYDEERDTDTVQRADARECAQSTTNRDPSPSLSPSPTKDQSSSIDHLEIAVTSYESRTQDEQPLLPPLDMDKACSEVETRMTVHTQKTYIMRGDDYKLLKQLLVSNVPLDFILAGIDYAFTRNKRISRFSYCFAVIKDRWELELAKRETVQPLRFEAHIEARDRAAPRSELPTPGPYVPRGLPPEVAELLEEEERSANRPNTS